jgi:hypothetical protein
LLQSIGFAVSFPISIARQSKTIFEQSLIFVYDFENFQNQEV